MNNCKVNNNTKVLLLRIKYHRNIHFCNEAHYKRHRVVYHLGKVQEYCLLFVNNMKKLAELYRKEKVEMISHYDIKDSFLGNNKPTFISTMAFLNREALDSLYGCDEYKSILPLRDKAFSKLEGYIC